MQHDRRADYTARIHRVMDHVERRLDQPLLLEDLARVAHFSPFHFHRIFSAMTGETLQRFVARLRVEKAANMLLLYPSMSVTAVALDCGFSGSASFARAFKGHFGVSASAWRKLRKAERKIRQAQRKLGEAGPDGGAYPPDAGAGMDPAHRRTAMKPVEATAVRIEDTDPMTVAYVRHVGPYAGDAGLFERLIGQLCRWAGPRNLLGPQAKMLSIYHDNPEVTDEDKLRVSMCVTVPPGTKPEGEVGVMEVAGGTCAFAAFEIEMDQYGAAWQWLYGSWLPASGFEPDDRPCYELYTSAPGDCAEGLHRFEICLPVRPA
jgi:AraC family transcriptional regulator